MKAVVTALATARLTALITEDEISEPLRKRVEEWADGATYGSWRERLAYIPTCRACSSVYSAFCVLVVGRWGGYPGRVVIGALASSQAALLVAGAADLLTNTSDRMSTVSLPP